jgi:hypothetical protein
MTGDGFDSLAFRIKVLNLSMYLLQCGRQNINIITFINIIIKYLYIINIITFTLFCFNTIPRQDSNLGITFQGGYWITYVPLILTR